MTFRLSTLALLGAALAVAACQPTLNSNLPVGPAAYEVVRIEPETVERAHGVLQPGDQVTITVFGEEDLSVQGAVIDQFGRLAMPLIGEISATEKSPGELAADVEQLYAGRFLLDPDVSVFVTEATPRTVTVEGDVDQPGVYPIQNGYTLLSAIAMAGSPTLTASLDEVLIYRQMDGEVIGGRFDLTDIRAGRAPDPALMPGDAIVVGYDNFRIFYQDFLRTAPLIGAFVRVN